MIRGTKKLLGVTRATEILLYNPMLKWCLNHGLKETAIHKYLKYESVGLLKKLVVLDETEMVIQH